jgi:hypothetical protein
MTTGSEFYSDMGQPTKFSFSTGDQLSDELAERLFSDSLAGEWAERRQEIYPEFIRPNIMYVVPVDSDEALHHVAWVQHKGLRPILKDSDIVDQFALCHVVCDCVLSQADTDAEGQYELPGEESNKRFEDVANCRVVNRVIKLRADELGAVYGPEALAGDRSKSESLTQLAIETMLREDYLRPQAWLANIQSGKLIVGAIARTLRMERQALMPVLDSMQDTGEVEHDNYSVRLGPAAFDLTEDNKTDIVRVADEGEVEAILKVRDSVPYDTQYKFKDLYP